MNQQFAARGHRLSSWGQAGWSLAWRPRLRSASKATVGDASQRARLDRTRDRIAKIQWL